MTSLPAASRVIHEDQPQGLSPDPYFLGKLRSISSLEELDAFHAGIKSDRRLTDGELGRIINRRAEIERREKQTRKTP